MVYNNFNIDIIDLQDKDLVIDSVTTLDNLKVVTVSKPIEKSNKSCIHCGSTNIKINSYYRRMIRFLDIGLFKSRINYKHAALFVLFS